MRNATSRRLSALLLLGLAVAACGTGDGAADWPADLVVHGAQIWTGVSGQPLQSALAISDGEFVAVGADADILPLAGPSTRVIDLAGAFVVPGFSDNHTHFSSAARFLDFNIMR